MNRIKIVVRAHNWSFHNCTAATSYGMNSIFKAYDIRGIYPAELNEETAFNVGKATALYLKAHSTSSGQVKTLVIGQDARTHSNSLARKVIEGVTSAGCHVITISQTTTPLFYFCVNTTGADGGIMVTASHNPAGYEGFKIVGKEGVPIGLQSGLQDIESLMDAVIPEGTISGSVEQREMIDDYVNFIVELSGALTQDFRRLRIVIDSSNGMTSLVLKNLLDKVKLNTTRIFFDIDERFPNHSPDISRKENLRQLSEKVVEMQADLGVAFDGDGDRVVLVDGSGAIVRSDFLLGLLFQAMNEPKTVYDLRISRSIKMLLGDKGFPSPVGYVHIKNVMREHDADLGGELSGHFYFKKLHFNESAVMVMLKILVMLNNSGENISEMLKQFQKYYDSGEIDIPVPDKVDKETVLAKIKNAYHDGKINDMDGITVEYSDWWFNVRFSNTEPLVRIVVEANSASLVNDKVQEIKSFVEKAVGN